MKKIQQVIDDSGIPAKLVRGVVRAAGLDSMPDIASHGIDGGFPGFTYTKDTVAFFKRHRADIVALVHSQAEDMGENPAEMVVGFGCLAGHDVHRKPEHEKRKALQEFLPSVCRCLYGGRLTEDDSTAANALAWFAAEEVARAFED